MSGEKERFSRRNYFVLKGFQLRFSALVFIVTFTVGVICVWTTYITTWNDISQQVKSKAFYGRIARVYDQQLDDEKNAEIISSVFALEFAEIFDRVSTVLVLRLLVGALILFVLSIFVSHKMAGPLFRMENIANSMRKGDLSVDLKKLRSGDEMEDLARAINGAITKLRTLMQKYQDMAGKLTELASKISIYTEGGQLASSESTKLIKELEVVSSQLVTEMKYFKVGEKKEDIP